MLAAAPVLPVRYVVNASRIADRRMIWRDTSWLIFSTGLWAVKFSQNLLLLGVILFIVY